MFEITIIIEKILDMITLDDIDKTIIELLGEDGRVPYAEIAKKVDLTSTAVGQRIRKMHESDIIHGFGVKLNRKSLGINVEAIITLKLNFAKIDQLYKVIGDYNEVEYCLRVTGEDCFIMKANLRDNNHLLEFINRLSAFGSTKTNIIIEQIV